MAPNQEAPLKLSCRFEQDRIELILKAVAEGASLESAAANGRICGSTLKRWKDIGKGCAEKIDAGAPVNEVEENYADFYLRLRKAELTVQTKHLKLIAAGGIQPAYRREKDTGELWLDSKTGLPRLIGTEGDWKANAWLLERRFHKEFGPKQDMNVESSGLVIKMGKDFDNI